MVGSYPGVGSSRYVVEVGVSSLRFKILLAKWSGKLCDRRLGSFTGVYQFLCIS